MIGATSREKIAATIVTGFLGAGKTSLVENMLKQAERSPSELRFALLINEFGACGIDRDILQGCGIGEGDLKGCARGSIIELANGCICCTVADDFLPAMEEILRRDPLPTHIVVETSGLALPKPLVKAFAWPAVENRVTVDGVIALADGVALAEGGVVGDPQALALQRAADEALAHESPVEELFEEQIACADLVVLTKRDLLSAEDYRRAEARLQPWLRAGVRVVPSSLERPVPNSVLLGLQARAEHDLDSRPSHHDGDEDHEHDDFLTVTLTFGELQNPRRFHECLARAIVEHGLLRVKGFLAHAGVPMRECVQGVGVRVVRRFDRLFAEGEKRSSTLVAIVQRECGQRKDGQRKDETSFHEELKKTLEID